MQTWHVARKWRRHDACEQLTKETVHRAFSIEVPAETSQLAVAPWLQHTKTIVPDCPLAILGCQGPGSQLVRRQGL